MIGTDSLLVVLSEEMRLNAVPTGLLFTEQNSGAEANTGGAHSGAEVNTGSAHSGAEANTGGAQSGVEANTGGVHSICLYLKMAALWIAW